MPEKDTFISWASVNNWIPIVISAVTIAISWAALTSRLSLIEQKVEYIAMAQKEMLELYKNTEQRYGELALKVRALEVIQEGR